MTDKEKRRVRRNYAAKYARQIAKAARFDDRKVKQKSGYVKHKTKLVED